MKSTNRFLQIARRDSIDTAPLLRVFGDASPTESDEIIEAMYVIGERRAASGHPVGIQEITTAIGGLVSDKDILDAAIDVCMQGLLATGYTESEAQSMLLDSTSSMMENGRAEDLDSLSTELRGSLESVAPQRIELPRNFGPIGKEGQSRYELRRLIGRGSQGCVYEAVDRIFVESGMPSYVALKIFHGAGMHRNFQEGTRTRRIRHKHVARVFDQGRTEDGEHYVVYELLDGLSLDSWVKHLGTPISSRQACSMVVSIAHGVQGAHNAGIVHRDLKPSNILVNREDEPVVTDFGISLTKNNYEEGKQYGARGSLAFMAPEQYDGLVEGAMPSSDIYALGGILYWLITNHFPNGDHIDEAVEWLDNRCDGGPHRLNQWGVDARLHAVMSKALSLDPADRYQSVEALAQDLEAYLENRPIHWLDQSVLVQGSLFAKRKPLVVSLVLLVLMAAGTSVGIWVNMRAALRQERFETVAAVEMESLQSQLDLEQARIEDLKEKSTLLKSLLETWIIVVKESDDPKDARRNLLFLHSLTMDDFVQDDPQLLADIIAQERKVGEEYLSTLKANSGSPLQIAYWHEILGEWNRDGDLVQARGHLLSAIELVEEYGPNDKAWILRLRSGLKSLGD